VAETALRIFVYALVAGLSPLALVAVLGVLTSRRGRTNGLAFAIGFLLAQTIAFAIAYGIGTVATTGNRGHTTVASVLELVFGVGLLGLAWLQWRRSPAAASEAPPRTEALLERLRGLRPTTAFVVGSLLGVGGVKRLSITIVAGATVGIAALRPVEDLALAVVYVFVASLLVWAPVSAYLVAGKRADARMTSAENWLRANEQRLTFVSTLVFGFLLTVDAIVRLV
jgi:cytochrome c biogenesis protein CcdA